MTLLAGLDLNAGRIRAVSGLAAPRPLPLDADTDNALPLAISLEGRRPEVGIAALQLCRRAPHLACVDFLSALGTERRWIAGRHRLDASQALALVFKKLQPALAQASDAAVVLPAYLDKAQTTLVMDLAKAAKLPVLGWVAASLAALWSAHALQPYSGPVLLLDADDHALTWSVATVDGVADTPGAALLAVQTAPALGVSAWKDGLIDAIANRCIRLSRRDPRTTGDTEQMLWEQLDGALEACRRGQLVELVIQSERWYQDLVLRPGEFEDYCNGLVRLCLSGLRELFAAARLDRPPLAVVATASAARLPGLLRTLAEQSAPSTHVEVLTADALAQAAQELAVRWHDRTLPRGPIDTTIRLRKVTRSKRPEPSGRNTKLPPRAKRLRSEEDDFSVTIDE